MVHLISLQVDMQHVREAHKIDSSNVTLKVMPGITRCHLDPNGFEKMRVSYAFQLFGTKVLQAFHLYKDKLEATLGRMDVTQEFFRIWSWTSGTELCISAKSRCSYCECGRLSLKGTWT
ncbi:hypothetical protein HPB51_009939 [Rhipicephalus microplus]|uniref:Uncharacterized protein n=1 Tax=Rhipicephalus microplus TaxID=6941 RepID=A0A9J6ETJ5_RHIMP|nr:hypothetical protein HPB51_009939 [Rhipicephalus microplus]